MGRSAIYGVTGLLFIFLQWRHCFAIFLIAVLAFSIQCTSLSSKKIYSIPLCDLLYSAWLSAELTYVFLAVWFGIAAFFMSPPTQIRPSSSKYGDNCCSLLLFERTSSFHNREYSSLNSLFWISLHNIFSALNNSITVRAPLPGLHFQFSCFEIEANSWHPTYDSHHLWLASILNMYQNVFFDNINSYKCFCFSDFWVSFIKCFNCLCSTYYCYHTKILVWTKILFMFVSFRYIVVLGETLLLSMHLLDSSLLLYKVPIIAWDTFKYLRYLISHINFKSVRLILNLLQC